MVLLTWKLGTLRCNLPYVKIWKIVHQNSPYCLIKNSYSSGSKPSHLIKVPHLGTTEPGLPSPFGTTEGIFQQRPSESCTSYCFANHERHPKYKSMYVAFCFSKPRTRGSMIWPSATKIFPSNSANVIC
jgi:hypothetical protein